MISFDVEVDMNDTLRYLQEMDERAYHMITVFEKAKKLLEAAFAANFASGGSLVGGWPPRQQPLGWPLMIRTGKLMGSLSNMEGPENYIHLTSAQFGTSVEYAEFHQYGTYRMPQRKIVFEPVGFAHTVGEMAADHIVNGALPWHAGFKP